MSWSRSGEESSKRSVGVVAGMKYEVCEEKLLGFYLRMNPRVWMCLQEGRRSSSAEK